MKYHFKFYKDKRGGYWAKCIELEGCRSEGENLEALTQNLKAALSLYLDEPYNSKVIFPLPQRISHIKRNILKIAVPPKLAFATLLRRARLMKKLSIRETARALGFKNHYSYQKLEKAKSANPELQTLAKLKKIFPEISVDEVLSE